MARAGAAVRRRRERPTRVVRVVDAQQLVVVALVGMLVRAWTVRVVHARPEIRVAEVLVLMIEAEVVPDLLTRDELVTCGRVVRPAVEVGVVQLSRRLCDVCRPGHGPDRGDPQPAVVPVRSVADLDLPGGGGAAPRRAPGRLGERQ